MCAVCGRIIEGEHYHGRLCGVRRGQVQQPAGSGNVRIVPDWHIPEYERVHVLRRLREWRHIAGWQCVFGRLCVQRRILWKRRRVLRRMCEWRDMSGEQHVCGPGPHTMQMQHSALQCCAPFLECIEHSVHSKSLALKCTRHSVHSTQWTLSTQCHSPYRHSVLSASIVCGPMCP